MRSIAKEFDKALEFLEKTIKIFYSKRGE